MISDLAAMVENRRCFFHATQERVLHDVIEARMKDLSFFASVEDCQMAMETLIGESNLRAAPTVGGGVIRAEYSPTKQPL